MKSNKSSVKIFSTIKKQYVTRLYTGVLLFICHRGAQSSGLSWLVWESYCYVTMQHFCKLKVISTDTGGQTSALHVNTSLIGQYHEQLQLVEMSVVFACSEKDRDQRPTFVCS